MTKKRDIKRLIEIDKMPHQTALIKQYLDSSREDGSEAYGLNFPWKSCWEKENQVVWVKCFKYFIPYPVLKYSPICQLR